MFSLPAKLVKFCLFVAIIVSNKCFTFAQKMETNFPSGSAISGSSELLVQLRMQGALPTANRLMQCTGFVLPNPSTPIYVTQIKGYAPSNIVHHLALYGCTSQPTNPCACPLRSRSTIFVSALNTPAVRFQPVLGSQSAMQIGGSSTIAYVFLEVHYHQALVTRDYTTGVDLQTQANAPTYFVGIFSIMGVGTINPGQSQFLLDTCYTAVIQVDFFGYQVHTHSLGVLVSVYNNYDPDFYELGRANPQFPQAFYPYQKGGFYSIFDGDNLMVRCVYNTASQTQPVYTIGVPGKKGTEMCFINFLYYSTSLPSTNPFVKGTCTADQSSKFPTSSTTLFQPNEKLSLHALYGNQTGIVTIDSTHSMDLDLETF